MMTNRRSRMRRSVVSVVVSALMMAGLLVSCRRAKDTAATKTEERAKVEYTLEVILPLTGNIAFMGVPIQNAILLAEEDWRQQLSGTNVSIKVVFGDSQGNPKEAVSIHSQNKARMKIDALFSFLSGQTLALKPIAAQENTLFVAATVDPSVTKESRNLIRPYYSFGAEAQSFLKVLKERKPRSVGIIYSMDSATAYAVEGTIIPGLKNMQVPVTTETFKVGDRDFRAQVLAIKTASPEVVLANGFGADLPFLINTLREQGVFPPATVLCPIGLADAIPSKGSEPFKGVLYFGPTFLHKKYETDNPHYAAFKKRYIERFGASQFGESCVYAYDTYQLLATAILAVRSRDAVPVFNYLVKNDTKGLAGIYNFDESGDCSPPVAFATVNTNGEVELLRVFE